jgi:hypothetical protein
VIKRNFTYLAIAIIFSVTNLLPFFVSISDYSAKADIESLKELYGEDGKVLICTKYGFKYISINDLQTQKDNNSETDHCPLCVVSTAKYKLGSQSDDYLEILLSLNLQNYKYPIENELFFHLSYYSQVNSRAPPKIS